MFPEVQGSNEEKNQPNVRGRVERLKKKEEQEELQSWWEDRNKLID